MNPFLVAVLLALVADPSSPVSPSDAATSTARTIASAPWYSDGFVSTGRIHGITEPIHFATISAPVETTLMTLSVTEGQQVEQGSVLAVMDNRVSAASVRAARITADGTAHELLAQVEVRRTQARLARITSAEAGAVSDVEIEEAQAQRDRALASLAVAQEQLRQARFQVEIEEAKLELHTVRAPFAGRVVRIYATVGDVLSGDEPLLEIADTCRLKAPLHLPLDWYGRLQPSRQYELWAGSPLNRPVTGNLVYVEPRIDAASQSFRCVFEIDNRHESLPSGFSVRFDPSPSDDQETAPRASPALAPVPGKDTRR